MSGWRLASDPCPPVREPDNSRRKRQSTDRDLYREFLARLPAHSTIAVEASGSYSWLVDEMERAGHRPKLANPFEAKRCMALTKKTDKLDARGLAILLHNGTLPEVWIPPSELRDQRELLRLSIFLVMTSPIFCTSSIVSISDAQRRDSGTPFACILESVGRRGPRSRPSAASSSQSLKGGRSRP